MKFVKLLLIFALLVGGIFAAFFWESIFSTKRTDNEFADVDQIDITEKCNEIRESWEAQKEWSEDLYLNHRQDIDQSHGMHMFSSTGYNTVNNALRESATKKAYDCYKEALKAPNFKDADLRRSYDNVVAIKNYEKIVDNDRIDEVENIHALYCDIKQFVGSNHAISPYFDKDKMTWTSFSARQNGILSQASKMRNNKWYGEVKHIAGFEEGLDEAKLRNITEPYRSSYYSGLSTAIIRYFQNEPQTPENLEKLNSLYDLMSTQDGGSYGVRPLAQYISSYNPQVEE